jgi:Flp pilus assembly pilin Flp
MLQTIYRVLQSFHRDETGSTTIEFVILATLVAAIMTLVMVALFNALAAKVRTINGQI